MAAVDIFTPTIALSACPAARYDTPGCRLITATAVAFPPIARSADIRRRDTCLVQAASFHVVMFQGVPDSQSALEVAADIADNPVYSLTCFRKNAPPRRSVFGFEACGAEICHFLNKDCLRKGHFEFKNAPLRAETSSVLAPVARVAELVDAQD